MKVQTSPLDLVLLVDDDDTTNYLNKRLLQEMQVCREVLVLKNGQEALVYLENVVSTLPEQDVRWPNLILLDIKMPVMDGFEFLEEYHTRGFDYEDRIIILMLTSSASFYDLERLKKFPKVKKHYSKALTKYDVQEIMNQYFNGHA
jgi:CheY-like chemotaxis protein